MIYVYLSALAVVLAVCWAIAFVRTRDAFHPLVVSIPMLVVMYLWVPGRLMAAGTLFTYLHPRFVTRAALIILVFVSAFVFTCLAVTTARRDKPVRRFTLPEYARKRLMFGAMGLGALSLLAYLYTIAQVGGFIAAYSSGKGGGETEYGYIRDAVFLSIPAVVLVIVARLGLGMTWRYRIAVAIISFPMIVQATLGGRRGPAFMLAVTIGVSWYMIRFRRPRVITLLAGGMALGFFMIAIVTYRSQIYIGSEFKFDRSLTEYVDASHANEYIYGAATMIHAETHGGHYWGKRYLAVVFVRPIPRQIWPTKYEDLGLQKVVRNMGLGDNELRWTVGWRGAFGAAPGIVADIFVEWAWFGAVAMALFGYYFGYLWWKATREGGFAIVLYVLSVAMMVFFVFQTLEAAIVRLLWMGIPAYFIWRWAISMGSRRGIPAYVPPPMRPLVRAPQVVEQPKA